MHFNVNGGFLGWNNSWCHH